MMLNAPRFDCCDVDPPGFILGVFGEPIGTALIENCVSSHPLGNVRARCLALFAADLCLQWGVDKG